MILQFRAFGRRIERQFNGQFHAESNRHTRVTLAIDDRHSNRLVIVRIEHDFAFPGALVVGSCIARRNLRIITCQHGLNGDVLICTSRSLEYDAFCLHDFALSRLRDDGIVVDGL